MSGAAPRRLRVLVTGASGFVGGHLVAILRARGHDVVPMDHHATPDGVCVDVTDPLAVRGAVELAGPDAIAHLAAQAFIPASLEDPVTTVGVNVGGTMNVLEAVRAALPAPIRLVMVSSADVYGRRPPDEGPVVETAPLFPLNPYAASKVGAEALTTAYTRAFGLDAVVTRAFNQIGPRQDERFAVASFAMQLARIASGEPPVIWVGNLDARRDFLDVRDVCLAYALLLEGGGTVGATYNVSSGRATSLKEILRQLILTAGVPVEVREDPERMRPSDIPVSVGDATKLCEATGWAPSIPLPAALRAVYDDALARLKVSL